MISQEGVELLAKYRKCSRNDTRGACVLHLPLALMCANCQANRAASDKFMNALRVRKGMSK